MKKILNNKIFIVIVTMIICISGTLYAASKYQASEVTYYNANNGDTTTVQEALDKLYDMKSCKSLCANVTVKVGDYIKMTPTETNYILPEQVFGEERVLNPSELNLWRVIKINDDGTVEIVSEYVSSTKIRIEGKDDFVNLPEKLNSIAGGYINSKYTISSRCMGYGGQQNRILEDMLSSTTVPWTSNTSNNDNEKYGGGDILYQNDFDLVKNAIGTLSANEVGTTTATSYWLSSRHYSYQNSRDRQAWFFSGRYINSDGTLAVSNLYFYVTTSKKFLNSIGDFAFRPIVVLKAGIVTSSGKGTSDEPYILQ